MLTRYVTFEFDKNFEVLIEFFTDNHVEYQFTVRSNGLSSSFNIYNESITPEKLRKLADLIEEGQKYNENNRFFGL